MSNLVSTDWLAQHLGDHDLIVLDASWHMPASDRNAHAEFVASHIIGARFFDLDAVSDQLTDLPHMMPSAERFSASTGALGIGNATTVVCYDSLGLFSAARCWWMFKTFGHDKVFVLDGGLKKWLAEGRTVESGELTPAPINHNYASQHNPAMVRSLVQVASGNAQVIDARSPARFRGEEPEPRPGVRPGHMPGALNVHYAILINPDGTLKTPVEISSILLAAGADLAKPVTTSCGSGVTAAIVSLALTEIGLSIHALYDGSWAEWGSSYQPIATGA